jgi:hypothetical protein
VTNTPAPQNQEPSVPDDIWEKFVRDTEAEIRASAPKEPSARARMVAERLRQQDAEAARAAKGKGRKGRKAEVGAQRQGWRTGPAARDADGRAARRRWRGAVAVLAAVGVVVVALNPDAALSWVRGRFDGSSGSATHAATLPPETAQPTTAPSATAGLPTLKHPFAGSPAEGWGSGQTAIVPPEAKALGTFSKSEVAGALRRAKEFLVEANLDPAVLRGARGDAALALLDPRMGKTVTSLRDGFTHPTKDNDPTAVFTRFDRKEVELVGGTVKVRGRMTFKETKDGTVRITSDYTFVYPLVRVGDDSQVTRTIVRRFIQLDMPDPRRFGVTQGKFWLADNYANFGNDECFTDDGFLHPHFSSGGSVSGAPRPTGSAVDPYDRSKPLAVPHPGECNVNSRT